MNSLFFRGFRPCFIAAGLSLSLLGASSLRGGDLKEIQASGVLRHVGVPYANFISGSGDGLDVELMQRFAVSLGVKYQYVQADWPTLFPNLTGRKISAHGSEVTDLGETPVQADIGANGITVLGWREKVVDFSDPTFPTQVWLIARKDSPVAPIKPTGRLEEDIVQVKKLMQDHTIFCKANTCLDPALYALDKTGSKISLFKGSLNDLAPAIIHGEAELTLLDVPDTLVAMQKWPGEVKVIGPVGLVQPMAVAFPKNSPELRAAFNNFFKQLRASGEYDRMVEKYYPFAFQYFPEFFGRKSQSQSPASPSTKAL